MTRAPSVFPHQSAASPRTLRQVTPSAAAPKQQHPCACAAGGLQRYVILLWSLRCTATLRCLRASKMTFRCSMRAASAPRPAADRPDATSMHVLSIPAVSNRDSVPLSAADSAPRRVPAPAAPRHRAEALPAWRLHGIHEYILPTTAAIYYHCTDEKAT